MDFNAIVKQMTASDSISQISAKTGASEQDVSSVLSSMLPQMLSGAQKQATNSDTAASFANALVSHGQKDSGNLASFLGGVDLTDGGKIVGHLLGQDKVEKKEQEVAEKSGISPAKIGAIVAAAAPLLMTLLGKQAANQASNQAPANTSGGLDLSGIVGSLFGGGNDKDGGAGAGGIGDLLSGLFK